MPIFQDDLSRVAAPTVQLHSQSPLPPLAEPMRRKVSEESIRTELCEGPVLEELNDHQRSPQRELIINSPSDTSLSVSSRVELIERLKRGESPTWLPNIHFESILQDYEGTTLTQRQTVGTARSPPLLPSPDIKETPRSPPLVNPEPLQAGLSIERPRSALHSGDFTELEPQVPKCFRERSAVVSNDVLYDSSNRSWLSTSPPRHFSLFQQDSRFDSRARRTPCSQTPSKPPSLSSSFSSSFIFKPPTSPLAQSESNDDGEYSPAMTPLDINRNSRRSTRRHTFQAYQPAYANSSMPTPSPLDLPISQPRRESSNPYQAHQPRRSVSSALGGYQTDPYPQTPSFLRPRRPSLNSDSSPLQLASMVGSYEESILRGRMSTTPSRPLDFVAQIGVLGLAVFYSYGTTSHDRIGKHEDGPSPYVGQIDLENGLPYLDGTSHDSRRRRPRLTPDRPCSGDYEDQDSSVIQIVSEQDIRRNRKQKRRSTSPRAPTGGSYRIPERGQLQIIIKNPNKTAVKLFLVPYDLAGMEPGTKTFIRQRCYSAGPILDLPVSASSPMQALDATNERSTLRYLIHLHVCCPARGRFYLYKSIRVVFANRVPDGKEKLRNEIQLPEPRFSVYKASRESHNGLVHGSSAGAGRTVEKMFRRRSSGFPLSPSHRAFDAMDGITQSLHARIAGNQPYAHANEFSTTPIEPIPFSLCQRKHPAQIGGESQMQSPLSSKSSHPSVSQDSGLSESWNSSTSVISGYDKLNKGDVGYGGNMFATSHKGQQAVAEGLLARKLKDLGVGKWVQESPTDGH